MTPTVSRLRAADLLPLGAIGLRTRRLRASLSAAGIAIGIASLVGVLGIAASSQANLLAQIDRLGTNLLVVAPGQQVGGGDVALPETAPAMLRGIDGVTRLASTAELADVHAYTSDLIPAAMSGSVTVRACDRELLAALDIDLTAGVFLSDATAALPVAVLGARAAAQLGAAGRIWLSGHWFTIAGVLRPQPLVPEVDRSVFIGFPVATSLYGYDGHPTLIYVRADVDRVTEVAAKLARTANPTNAHAVNASRPSDALTARLAVARSGTGLFLGLGAIALAVGALGIANVMVIAVLERRGEIGLRRALGARRSHIAAQFVTESLLLSAIGGVAGIAAGATVTVAAATAREWTATIPVWTPLAGLGIALVIGTVAGLYPAIQAARVAPTTALRS